MFAHLCVVLRESLIKPQRAELKEPRRTVKAHEYYRKVGVSLLRLWHAFLIVTLSFRGSPQRCRVCIHNWS